MAQGIPNLTAQVADIGSQFTQGQVRGQKVAQSKMANLLQQRQLESSQRQDDMKRIKNFIDTEGKVLTRFIEQGDEQGARNYLEKRKASPDLGGSLERLGMSDVDVFGFTDAKGKKKLGIEQTTKMNPKLREKIRSKSGFDPSVQDGQLVRLKIGPDGDVVDIKSDIGSLEGIKTRTAQNKLVRDTRNDFDSKPIIKDTNEINSAISRMDSVWSNYQKNRSKKTLNALDQALVITFNKMLDPGSVVRESEFARTPQGQAILSRAEGFLDQLQAGGVGLTDLEREDILNTAKQLSEGQKSEARKVTQQFVREAEILGIDPKRIVGDFFDLTSDQPPINQVKDPQQGQFVTDSNGVRFKINFDASGNPVSRTRVQ